MTDGFWTLPNWNPKSCIAQNLPALKARNGHEIVVIPPFEFQTHTDTWNADIDVSSNKHVKIAELENWPTHIGI